ncbi:hypothetical protein [Methylobacterium sp. J-067]|uniref:antitoxin PaaA2 family protein n=1 Tax=Methylobacterium sp. J-067 TaxID=2836648 RepID=UPI001FBA2896|nr:hypothetical protein [Methylobacterium sp. J-067]MCJ2027346.1 hypothetical protein [Methylobacterium sp. J-067]
MHVSKPEDAPIDWETSEFDAYLRAKVQEALDDPRPTIPAEEVFARLRAYHAERLKAAVGDA